jgi:hypothetical protein
MSGVSVLYTVLFYDKNVPSENTLEKFASFECTLQVPVESTDETPGKWFSDAITRGKKEEPGRALGLKCTNAACDRDNHRFLLGQSLAPLKFEPGVNAITDFMFPVCAQQTDPGEELKDVIGPDPDCSRAVVAFARRLGKIFQNGGSMESLQICAKCYIRGKDKTKFKRCSRCKRLCYCSVECQVGIWKRMSRIV